MDTTIAIAYSRRSTFSVAGTLLAAKLRRSNADGAAGAVEEVARIVARQIRRRWPRTRILLQAIPASPGTL